MSGEGLGGVDPVVLHAPQAGSSEVAAVVLQPAPVPDASSWDHASLILAGVLGMAWALFDLYFGHVVGAGVDVPVALGALATLGYKGVVGNLPRN